MLPGRKRDTVADTRSAPSGVIAWLRAGWALLVRPDLWATALRLSATLVPRGWWRRAPFLPLPSRGYLRFRAVTAYGTDRPPAPQDLVDYLSWCRDRRA